MSRAFVWVGWILVALVAAFLLVVPYVMSSFFAGLFTQFLFFAVLAMSVGLLGGYTGLMPMGHAAIMGVGAYALGYLIARVQAPMGLAVVGAVGITLAVSLVFGLMAIRTSGIFFSMITLAQGMLVWGAAYRWYQVTGAENGLRGIERPFFAIRYYEYYYLVLAVAAASALAFWLVVRSPFGLTLQGIRESESRMRTLGYNVALHKLIAFEISGLFAAVSGLLFAWYNNYISPASVGLPSSAEAVFMVILGGAGTLVGPVIGAGVVVFAKNILSLYLARWPTVMGLIFVLAVLFARDGLVGFAQRFAALAWRRLSHERLSLQPAGERPPAQILGEGMGGKNQQTVE